MDIHELIKYRPLLHCGETETKRKILAKESFLEGKDLRIILNNEEVCWGLGPKLLLFLYKAIPEGGKTLEIGSGLSTLVFSLKSANHYTITPNPEEVEKIKQFAQSKNMDIGNINFIIGSSDIVLPNLALTELDLILMDGKKAFPWPIIDWFYTVNKLKKGGLLIIHHISAQPNYILKEFMDEDNHWEFVANLPRDAVVYKKTSSDIQEVAWHMQPYIANRYKHNKYRLGIDKALSFLNILKRLLGKK